MNSSLDETIEVNSSSSAEDDSQVARHIAEQVGPAKPDSSLDETVKTSGSPPSESDSRVTQTTDRPDTVGNETQPTVQVDAGSISETQPTLPLTPPAPRTEPATAFDKTQPVRPFPPEDREPPPFIRRGTGFSLPLISRWPLVAAAGIGILVVLASIGLWLSVEGKLPGGKLAEANTLTPTATATLLLTVPTKAEVTSPPQPSSTSPATNTPVPPAPTPTPVAPTATPRPDPTALEIGVLAKATPPEGLKLKVRAEAGIGGELLGELEVGAQVKIVDGPIEANDLTWWKVDDGAGLVGWSAEGVGSDTYLVPVGWAE